MTAPNLPSQGSTSWYAWAQWLDGLVRSGGGGYTDEQVRDLIGSTIVAGANVTKTVDDAGNTVTIAAAGGTGDGTVTAANITDATTVGRNVLTAASQSAARTAIGAGTSSLAIGTTSTTAAAGNDSRITGAAPASAVEGIVIHNGSAGGGTRPSGFARVRWVGGTARPTNMATGDVWEHDA